MVGDHAGADFLNTIDSRGYPDEREHFTSYQALLQWMARAELMKDAQLKPLRARAAHSPSLADSALADTRRFREAAHRIVHANNHDRKPAVADVTLVRETIETAQKARELDWTGKGLALRWRDPDDLHRPLYEAALKVAELFEPENFKRVHVCEGDECDWAFLDRSPTQRRRWCHMSACGNRAKVRNMRARAARRKRA
jgi:predicted RNA-binding Zn ribbon-like protein